MSAVKTNHAAEVSFAGNQELVWLAQQMHSDSPLFEVPYLYEIEGELDPAVLVSTFNELVRKSDNLRIVATDTKWSRPQLLHSGTECEFLDVSMEQDAESVVGSLITERLKRTFDPTHLLCHATLFCVGKSDWRLLVKIHHAFTDALNGRALLRNLSRLYEANLANRPTPRLPNYQNYLDREAETPAGQRWWSDRSTAVEETRFFRASATPGTTRHTRVVHRDPTLDAAIDQLAGRAPFRQVTPSLSHFNVLATALVSWLHRLSSTTEVISIGATAHGRSSAEFRETIGLFMQLLPLRVAVNGNDTFESVSRKVAGESMGFLQNALPGSMSATSQSAFDVVLNLIDLEVDDFCGMPTSMRWLHNGHGEPSRRLCLSAHRHQEGWEFLFDFNDGVFDAQERQLAIDHFSETLRSIAGESDQPLKHYPLLTEPERLQNERLNLRVPTEQATRFESVWQQFRSTSLDRPSSPAVICETATWSYGELLDLASSIARSLDDANVGPLVPILCRRDAFAVAAMLGVLASERCFLPVDRGLPEARVNTLLKQSGVSQFLDATDRKFRIADIVNNSAVACPLTEAACYVLFTSGTTGNPSGVVVADASLLNLLEDFERVGPLDQDSKCGWWTNVGFDVAIYEVFSAVLFGRSLHIPSEEVRTSASAMVEWLERNAVNSLYLPPYFLRRLADRLEDGGTTCLRRLLVGVEPIPQNLLASIAGSTTDLCLINGYGPTETTICATLELIDPIDRSSESASIGRPVCGNQLMIVDINHEQVPPGVPGELWISGVGVARGYLRDPVKTRERFLNRGGRVWYRSGDQVRLRRDGKLQFLGRTDDQLKISGHRIEPAEVSATIRSLENVTECVVLPLLQENKPVGLVAFVECCEDWDEAKLRSELGQRLPRAMMPARIVLLDRLPRSVNGKVDRQHLRSLISKSLQRVSSGKSDAKTPVEFTLAEIWKSVLGRASVGVEDDFFALGGSSLDAMTIVDRAGELGLRFSLPDLFRCLTIRQLATQLESTRPMESDQGRGDPGLLDEQSIELTSRQLTLWYQQQANPDSFAYHFQVRCRVNGPLKLDRIRQCLDALSARHCALRTTIGERDGLPIPVANARPIVDPATATDWEDADVLSEGQRRFDLSKEPPWRVAIVETGSLHELVWTFHHIGFDQSSIAVLLEEFARLYRGDPLPARPAESHPDEKNVNREVGWWRTKLADVDLRVQLPVDRSALPISDAGALYDFSIPTELTNRLRESASDARVSLNNFLLSAFGVMLHKYSGMDSFTIGVPLSRRGSSREIGYHVDAFPFVFHGNDDLPFDVLARRIQEDFVAALQHAESNVESLQQEFGNLFNVMFVPQQPLPTLVLDNETWLVPHIADLGASKFDWTLFVREESDSIQCALEYRTDSFEKATIERFARHWLRLLNMIVVAVETRAAELDVRSPDDLHASALLAKGGGAVPCEATCVSEQFEIVSATNPTQPAIICGDNDWTYESIDRWANGIARALIVDGVEEEEPVLVACERSAEMIAAVLGILKAGAAYVPVDPDFPEKRLEDLICRVDGSRLLTDDVHFDRFQGLRGRAINVSRVQPDERFCDHGRSLDSLAYVLHTSGSTGAPKGVEVTRAALLQSNTARNSFYESPPERFLMVSPFWFDSSIAGLFWTLCNGGSLVLSQDEDLADIGRLAALIQRHQVTDTLMLPSLYRLLLRHSDSSALGSLRRVIVAGESCSDELVQLHHQTMPSTRLFNEYGPTEASVWATACELDGKSPVTIGQSVPGVSAKLLDHAGRETPIGCVGEIHLGGSRLARGYRNDDDLTKLKFIDRDGQRLYRTGDLARLRSDGSLVYLSRSDQQLKVNGQRVEGAEIETALESIPGIREAAVAVTSTGRATLLEDDLSLANALSQMDHSLGMRLLAEAEAISTDERPKEFYDYADEKFQVTIQWRDDSLISTPRDRQKKWLLDQTLRETAADLHALDSIARRMVPGSDAPHLPRDLSVEQLSEQEIMEDWQTPLMKSMVEWVTESRGDILEIGFGRGVAATAIQESGVRSHTIVEMNPHSIVDHFHPWRKAYGDRMIRLIEGRWQDTLDQLTLYDGVFFHAFPMNESEFVEYVSQSATFAEHFFIHAASLLRRGGVFTYLSTEIESLSRRHQRSLLQHFDEVQLKVQRLSIPQDTKDAWWADSMVVVRAIK